MVAGESLSAAIDRGLASARSGVVVISPAFIETTLESGWTHYELRGIVSSSIGAHGKRILPIWLDVTPDEVRAWSPPLSDLFAIDASGKPIEQVALDVMRVIVPDRAGGLARMRTLLNLRRQGPSLGCERRRQRECWSNRRAGRCARQSGRYGAPWAGCFRSGNDDRTLLRQARCPDRRSVTGDGSASGLRDASRTRTSRFLVPGSSRGAAGPRPARC
jgi:hypothetical protein